MIRYISAERHKLGLLTHDENDGTGGHALHSTTVGHAHFDLGWNVGEHPVERCRRATHALRVRTRKRLDGRNGAHAGNWRRGQSILLKSLLEFLFYKFF